MDVALSTIVGDDQVQGIIDVTCQQKRLGAEAVQVVVGQPGFGLGQLAGRFPCRVRSGARLVDFGRPGLLWGEPDAQPGQALGHMGTSGKASRSSS